MSIPAYPLTWPEGWKRVDAAHRASARFAKASRRRYDGSYESGRQITIAEGVERLRDQLQRMGVLDDDLVISSNLVLRLDGLPRSAQAEPRDPGVAVYWRRASERNAPPKCMAIDRYDRVADNLAAIAATLEAMRAIERHGGAAILDRAFTGFVAIESPDADWVRVLGVAADLGDDGVRARYRYLRSLHHPDNNGDAEKFDQVQKAWAAYCRANGSTETE